MKVYEISNKTRDIFSFFVTNPDEEFLLRVKQNNLNRFWSAEDVLDYLSLALRSKFNKNTLTISLPVKVNKNQNVKLLLTASVYDDNTIHCVRKIDKEVDLNQQDRLELYQINTDLEDILKFFVIVPGKEFLLRILSSPSLFSSSEPKRAWHALKLIKSALSAYSSEQEIIVESHYNDSMVLMITPHDDYTLLVSRLSKTSEC